VPASFPDPISYTGASDVADTVTGGLAADMIVGRASGERASVGDTFQGGGGNDVLLLQPNAASVARGGDGNDYIEGGRSLLGEEGHDELNVNFSGAAVVQGGPGNDRITGGTEDDLLFGNDGDDTLLGRDGDDKLVPGSGSDQVLGGGGTNKVEMVVPSVNNGADVVTSGSDRDTLDYSAVNAGNLVIVGAASATSTGSVRLAGGTVADTLVSSFGVVIGGGGNDSITDGGQGTGVHRFIGGPGNDVINAGDGPDELFGGLGVDNLKGGEGDDLIDAVDGIEDDITCGAGLDFASLDLVDPDAQLGFGGKAGTVVTDVCEGVERANRKEGPNVEIVTRTGRVERDGSVPVRLRCPKDAMAPCKGTLSVVLQRGGAKRPAATSYALRKGASAIVRARLTAAELKRARGEALVVTSVEKGKFGPKTTNRVMPPA
jgi:Ca2+-binding RTX toxin-like protein